MIRSPRAYYCTTVGITRSRSRNYNTINPDDNMHESFSRPVRVGHSISVRTCAHHCYNIQTVTTQRDLRRISFYFSCFCSPAFYFERYGIVFAVQRVSAKQRAQKTSRPRAFSPKRRVYFSRETITSDRRSARNRRWFDRNPCLGNVQNVPASGKKKRIN